MSVLLLHSWKKYILLQFRGFHLMKKESKKGLPSSSMSNAIFAGMAAIQKHSVSLKALLPKAIFPATCNETEDDGFPRHVLERTNNRQH